MKVKVPEPPRIDYAAIAEKVVATSANIKEGEIVEVSGSPADMPLLEEIVLAVRKRGAFPLLTVSTETLTKKLITGVPEKWDTQVPKLALELNKIVNVKIIIPAVRDGSILAMLPPERQIKHAKAEQQVGDLARKRNIRHIELSNGLAPSPSRARELGVSEADLAKIYWDGLSADYSVVEAKCRALRDTLAKAGELRITAPNGTDLKVKVKGRKVFVSDGVTTDAERKAGFPGVNVYLPAGDVYVTPVAGTATGKLIDDRMLAYGKEILGVTVDVAKGKSTNVAAKSGWEALKARYDAAGPGKNELGFINIGCNPAVRSTGKLETWQGGGAVSIGFGNNQWAGGTNKEPFSLIVQLSDATVAADGTAIIETGLLK